MFVDRSFPTFLGDSKAVCDRRAEIPVAWGGWGELRELCAAKGL